jgi:hypothetical protein
MCAMDRSQIMVYSQSEIINHLEDLLSISSSQSFVRDAPRGVNLFESSF